VDKSNLQQVEVNVPAGAINGEIIYEDEKLVVMLGKPEGHPSIQIRSTRNVSNYESVWMDGPSGGNLEIYNANTGSFGMTLKLESSDSSAWAFCTVVAPNGNHVVGAEGINLSPNYNNGKGWYTTIRPGMQGTYKIEYAAYGTAGMRLMCWIY